jgi:transposase
MVTRRRFSREFKLEAVNLVRDRGVAVAQAARDLDVHENVLRKWVKELATATQNGLVGAGAAKPEQVEMARLRKENAKLRMERDILKKAAAYFAKESI